VDVEVECREKGVRCECAPVEYVGSSLDKMKHDLDSVWKVFTKANTARETVVLARLQFIVRESTLLSY
jgi:hypothetical protein